MSRQMTGPPWEAQDPRGPAGEEPRCSGSSRGSESQPVSDVYTHEFPALQPPRDGEPTHFREHSQGRPWRATWPSVADERTVDSVTIT